MDYWQERSVALKQKQIDTADALILFLKDLYAKTSIKINKDIKELKTPLGSNFKILWKFIVPYFKKLTYVHHYFF